MSDDEFLKHIEDVPVTVDQWQLEKLALVTTRRQLLSYVPGLPPQYRANLWGRVHETLDTALEAHRPRARSAIQNRNSRQRRGPLCASSSEALFAGLPQKARVAVIPEGPYVLAKANIHEMAAV